MFRSLGRLDDRGRDERIWVGDFGIAKDLAQGRSLTIASGTPHYMSPEQAEGRADERSDIYAAGVVLYQMLAGVVPYPYDSLPQILRAQLTEGPPPIERHRPDVPPALAAALSDALAIDPAARPQSASAWADRLRHTEHAAFAGLTDVGAVPDETDAAHAEGTPVAPHTFAVGWSRGASSDPPGPGRSIRGNRRLAVALPIMLVLAVLAAVAAFVFVGDDEATAELLLEPVSSVGVDPFTGPIVVGAPGGPVPDDPSASSASGEAVIDQINPGLGSTPDIDFTGLDLPTSSDGAITNVAGAAPGLYGGTNVIDICDRDQLVDFLEQNPAKARAWAGALGIEVDAIRGYVAGLTDVVLQTDTRVTNHGFDGADAYPIDSVLQAGTAVLVDDFGVPRVRCFCGNPLDVARPLAASEVEEAGTRWPGFALERTVIVTATERVDQLVLDDVSSDALVARTPGSPARTGVLVDRSGEPVSVASPTPPPTPAPTASPTPTPPPPTIDITATGSVAASSTFDASFAADLARDGNRATSWFSAGGGSATFTWAGERSFIDTVDVLSNAAHETVEFRTGFGFGEVDVTVLHDGAEVYTASFDLDGSPDPDISVEVAMMGDTIVLDFRGGEDPACGGFAELVVSGWIA